MFTLFNPGFLNSEQRKLEMCLESFKFQRNVHFLHSQRDVDDKNREFSELGLFLDALSEMCFCAADGLGVSQSENTRGSTMPCTVLRVLALSEELLGSCHFF